MKVPRLIGLSYATECDEIPEHTRDERAQPIPISPVITRSPVIKILHKLPSQTDGRARPAIIKFEDDSRESISAPAAVYRNAAATRTKASSTRVKDESTAEDRRNILIQDDRCTDVEPQSVLCTMCKRRVGLHAKKDYSLSNWFKHARSCAKSDGK